MDGQRRAPVRFGQLVIGAPGAGKTTYCDGMRDFLRCIDREPAIVNLDPANENIPETPFEVCITSLVSLEKVMEESNLGPNGGLVYCLGK